MENYILHDKFINREPLKSLLKEIFKACNEADFDIQVRCDKYHYKASRPLTEEELE
jgi:hypothetical protein